jgi:hypothetical protein
MGNWLFGLPVLWMALVVLAATYLVTAGIYLAVTKLATGERAAAFKGISPGVLPPLAVVFALLVGFLAAQVWNDNDRAGSAVNREASALRAAVLLGSAFPGETNAKLRDLIHRHIEQAVSDEWPAMAHRTATLTIVPRELGEALRVALTITPTGESQVAAQRELIASLQSALDARRQRIVLSESSLNWVKWAALLAIAVLNLVAVALVHADNRGANRIILPIFASGIAIALLLIASHSRPFTGEVAVKPSVLEQVMPEAGAKMPRP